MNLTEYELVDLAVSLQEPISSTTSVFLTILSGYLVVAWLVGGKLNRAQAGLISALFLGFQVMTRFLVGTGGCRDKLGDNR